MFSMEPVVKQNNICLEEKNKYKGGLSKSKLKVFFIAISRNNKGRKLIFGMEPVVKQNKRYLEEKLRDEQQGRRVSIL